MSTETEHAIKLIDDNINTVTQLVWQKNQIWVDLVVFSWRWWIGLGFSVLPWILWIIFRKKDSTDRLLYVALFVISLSVFADVIGDQYGIWHYRFNVLPIVPTYFPWDFTLMPVTILFFLQYQRNLNPWWKAVIFAGISSFVAEPFFEFLDVYVLIKWKNIYSFPIQVVIYIASFYISKRNQFQKLDLNEEK